MNWPDFLVDQGIKNIKKLLRVLIKQVLYQNNVIFKNVWVVPKNILYIYTQYCDDEQQSPISLKLAKVEFHSVTSEKVKVL